MTPTRVGTYDQPMTSNSTQSNTLRISYFITRNRYAGKCVACSQTVERDKGWTQKDDGKWQTVCNTCARAHAKYLPTSGLSVPALNDAHVGGRVYECLTCGREVALVQSRQNSKWFFCEVVASQAHRRYAATHQPHTSESCAERKATNDAIIADDRRRQMMTAAYQEWCAEIDRRGGMDAISTNELVAMQNELLKRQQTIAAEGQMQ